MLYQVAEFDFWEKNSIFLIFLKKSHFCTDFGSRKVLPSPQFYTYAKIKGLYIGKTIFWLLGHKFKLVKLTVFALRDKMSRGGYKLPPPVVDEGLI